MFTAAQLLGWARSLDTKRQTFDSWRLEVHEAVAELNEILAEQGDPPTTIEEVVSKGILTIPVRNIDVPVEVEIEVFQ